MEMKPPELDQQRYRRPPSPPMFDCSLLFNDFPLEPAPAFPPAPAILDDTESNMLDNFFSTMNSSPFDNNDFWFSFNDSTDKNLGGNYNGGTTTNEQQPMHDNTQSLLSVFEWPDETQPSFGISAPLPSPPFHGNAPMQSHSIPHTTNTTRMGGLQKQGPLSSDVLAAASMLYQNNTMPEYPQSTYQNQHHISLPSSSSMDVPRTTKRPRVEFEMPSAAASSITPPPSTNTTSPKFPSIAGSLSASDIYFQNLSAHHPSYNRNAQHDTSRVERVPLRWGSDASFSHPRYAAPPDQPSIEDRTRHMLKHLECLETTHSSVAPSRASSPTGFNNKPQSDGSIDSPTSRDMRNLSLNDKFTIAAAVDNTTSQTQQQQQQQQQQVNGRVSKRRRSTKRMMEDDETTPTQQSPKFRRTSLATSEATKTNPTNRRYSTVSKASITSGNNNTASANGTNNLASSSSSSSGSRRRSSACKVMRENLSEEQKRANHILSEQKRRDLIKNGFEDLCTLVPKLNGGGFSKSMMLVQAADWLEDLLRGNEILKRRLMAMDGHTSV
ncbi:Helix-loop-helix DNA-binding protein [Ascosphaera apis ARSEF 7405]|uniref:Helix-loop-helix DNA-binding protein n=1 Tax=Ascosphaera apis ARSEF 7405 TaxID=392613 RepID=A0A168AHE2_9EURO|nr:Helix-loop-helix DNA-binding protein [Ascosphaera apis ARSEF 7405]